MNDPWAFGWTQLLTCVGLLLTLSIAVAGFKTFSKWKREKIEERKIEIAFEALAIAYESKYIFEHIRSPMSFENEWKDMPRLDGETDQQWDRRGPYYAIGKRIELNKEFFERSFKFQPRCMAMFGQRAEDIFMLMHTARREIEVASQMLTWMVRNEIGQVPIQDENFWQQCRRAIWDYGDFEPERDKVGNKLKEFRQGMEILCRPVVDLYKR